MASTAATMSKASAATSRPVVSTISCGCSAFRYSRYENRERIREQTQAPHHGFITVAGTVRHPPSVPVWALAVQTPPAIRRGSTRLAIGTNQAPTTQPGLIDCMLRSNTSALSRTRRNQMMKTTAVARPRRLCSPPADPDMVSARVASASSYVAKPFAIPAAITRRTFSSAATAMSASSTTTAFASPPGERRYCCGA